MWTPDNIITLEPIHTSSPITTGYSFVNPCNLIGIVTSSNLWFLVIIKHSLPIKTSFPIDTVTPINNLCPIPELSPIEQFFEKTAPFSILTFSPQCSKNILEQNALNLFFQYLYGL